MQQSFKELLFSKHILVNDVNRSESQFQTAFCLAHEFGIKIVKGIEKLDLSMIDFCSKQLGKDVPQPFYVGFPDSVKQLAVDQLLFDQLYHYVLTYGLGDFSSAGHSVFEQNFERVAFTDKIAVKEFVVLTEKEAQEHLTSIAYSLLSSTRPLNVAQYELVLDLFQQGMIALPDKIGFNTAINLLCDTRDMRFASYLQMSDVVKVVEWFQFYDGAVLDLKHLNLSNQQRKFVSALIDYFAENNKINLNDCYEKKQIWCGLLHHIHYKAKCELGKNFVNFMRNKGNLSVYSMFEREIACGNVSTAVAILQQNKGDGALLRNINYILSRCASDDQIKLVLDSIDSGNTVVLIQLLIQIATEKHGPRTFIFTKNHLLKHHVEESFEVENRKSYLSDKIKYQLKSKISQLIERNLKGRLNKVFVHPSMKKIALPLQETTGSTGLGVLPKGSRVVIPDGNVVRAFTYWEKVNDIDLSAFGLTNDGEQIEFSWRTMFAKQSESICYSGDQVSGYNGGSEYFDIDIAKFKKQYQNVRYIVFANNVYSASSFSECFCKAGYMLREAPSSGEVFEPKTVQTSFVINAQSTFAYLFAIDLEKMEMIWLNLASNRRQIVAGETSFAFLDRYLNATDIINVYDLFNMLATNLVDSEEEADCVVSDTYQPANNAQQVIRSYEYDKILPLINTISE